VISFVVNLGVTIGLHEGIGTRPELAYGVALITVFLMNFIFFRYYVFVQEHPSPIGQQFLIYAGSAIGFRLMEYASFFIIHSLFGLYYVTTVILVQGVAFIVKFFFYGKVFHGRSANST
jgi:putative flippase GtrA